MNRRELLAELKATIRLDAHHGDPLADESIASMANGVLETIERLGFAIVPREPDPAMLRAGWDAMIQAAGEPTPSPAP